MIEGSEERGDCVGSATREEVLEAPEYAARWLAEPQSFPFSPTPPPPPPPHKLITLVSADVRGGQT